MAWNNADELVVAGNGQIYVAPTGTTLPTTPTGALDAAFAGLGYASEDGVTLTVDPEVTEFNAWQSRQAVRRELTAQAIQVSFELLQWDEDTLPLAFGGGAVTAVGGGGYRYDFPDEDASLDERAMVVDAIDGGEAHRFVFPRGNVTDSVAATFKRSELAMLPITFKALEVETGGAAAYYLTDSTEFAAGS